jgi:hypothetical protein
MKNAPYIKVLDAEGNVINPISGSYTSPFPNRKARRIFKNRERFTGNGKTAKFKRVLQFAPVRDENGVFHGKFNRIEHYLPS